MKRRKRKRCPKRIRCVWCGKRTAPRRTGIHKTCIDRMTLVAVMHTVAMRILSNLKRNLNLRPNDSEERTPRAANPISQETTSG